MSDTPASIRATVDALVTRIVADYAPQKVILYGSHAWGQPREDSDIDLFVIKNTPERFWDRADRIRRILTGLHRRVPLDVLVYTPEELASRLCGGDQFVSEIISRGEVLYAA